LLLIVEPRTTVPLESSWIPSPLKGLPSRPLPVMTSAL
jgi:hypothetical protein